MTDEQMDARLHRAGESWRASEPRAAATFTETPAPALRAPSPTPAPARRAHRRIGLLASAALVVAALVAGGVFLLNHTAGKGNTAATAPLEGTVWRLVAYDAQAPRDTSLATLYIDDHGQFLADDGCTLVTASAGTSGGRLHLGAVEPRYYGCTDSGGALTFDRGLPTLTGDPSWSIDGRQLTIAHPGGPTLHLQADATLPAPTADVPTLPGASWRLVGVTADGNAHRVIGTPSLQLKGGKLLASDGCNTLSGDATVAGTTLVAPQLASTAIGCTSQIGYTASVVDAVLGSRPTWSIRGNRLTLQKAGTGTLGYEWAPADKTATDPGALTGREWVLASIAGVPARALGSLGVDARGPASGTDGCTDLDATAAVGPGTLTLTGIPTARPAVCTGAPAEQAATIDSILNQKPALWSVRGNRLVIYGGGPQALSLVYETGAPPPSFPSSAPDPSVLGGRTWKITSIETTGSGSSSSQSSSGITLTFDSSGGYRLTSRCGGQDGKVALGRGTATFSEGRPEGGNYCVLPDLNRAATTLAGAVAWQIDNGELRLTKGATTLVFAPS